jgi:hypothetical protein
MLNAYFELIHSKEMDGVVEYVNLRLEIGVTFA